jgi:hypothetical protein
VSTAAISVTLPRPRKPSGVLSGAGAVHRCVAGCYQAPGLTARTEMLFTPYFALALRACSEMNS